MKKYLFFFLSVAVLLCCLSSCKMVGDVVATEPSSTQPPTTVTDGVHFEKVSDLLKAIKYDPYNYLDKEIQVRGTVCKFESETILFDYKDYSVTSGVEFRSIALASVHISIVIPDDILYTVLDSGDYITVSGVVKISDGTIYLSNCTYIYNS